MQEYKSHIIHTLKLSIPIAIGQLGHILMGVVDSVMVGKVGEVPLAASSLVNGLYFLIVVLGLGMTSIITPLIAIEKGAENNEECGIILNQALIVNFVFSLIVLGILLFGTIFFPLLGQTDEVTQQAMSYMQILAFSSIPFLVFQVYKQFCEGLSVVYPPMYIAIIANIGNAFFNWIFIFGKFGFPAMGLEGAGYSTLFTRSLMAIALMWYVFKTDKFKTYKLHFRLREITPRIISKLIRLGLPSGLQYFVEVAAFAFAAIMIGWIGSTELAAHQIAMNLASVTYMIILGISSAGTIRVGDYYGKKDWIKLRQAGFTTIVLCGLIMACFGITFILTRNILPMLYINEKDVIETASNLIIVAALFQIFDGTQAAGIGILRGMTDVKIPMVLSLISYWMISIPIAAYLGFALEISVVGIWIGLSIGLALVSIIMMTRFQIISKKLK